MTTRIHRSNHIALGYLVKALDEPRSTDELASLSGLAVNTVRQYVRTWKRVKAVRVGGWDEDCRGRMTIRLWTLGNRPDAIRPRKPIDNAARMRAVRARDRAHREVTLLAA